MSDIAERNGAVNREHAAQIEQFIRNPLLQLPPEWVPIVFDFWAFWSDIFRKSGDMGQLGLCSRVRYWMTDEGLTLDVLARAAKAIKKAATAATFQWPSEVLAALAAEIEKIERADRNAEIERANAEREKKSDAAWRAEVQRRQQAAKITDSVTRRPAAPSGTRPSVAEIEAELARRAS